MAVQLHFVARPDATHLKTGRWRTLMTFKTRDDRADDRGDAGGDVPADAHRLCPDPNGHGHGTGQPARSRVRPRRGHLRRGSRAGRHQRPLPAESRRRPGYAVLRAERQRHPHRRSRRARARAHRPAIAGRTDRGRGHGPARHRLRLRPGVRHGGLRRRSGAAGAVEGRRHQQPGVAADDQLHRGYHRRSPTSAPTRPRTTRLAVPSTRMPTAWRSSPLAP